MAGTLAFDLKDALVAALKADPALADLAADEDAISYGFANRGAQSRPREVIAVGEIEWDDEIAIALGYSRRDEFFRIMLTIESHGAGETQQEANYHVRDRMKVVEALVRDPRWSGLPLLWSELKPRMLGEGPDDSGGRGAVLVLSLHVVARKS